MGEKMDESVKAGLIMAKQQMEEKAGKFSSDGKKTKKFDQDKFLKKLKDKKKQLSKLDYDILKLTRPTQFPKGINPNTVLEVAKSKLWENSKDMNALNASFASLLLLKDFTKANYEYKKGTNIDRNNRDLNYNLAEMYFRRGEFDKSILALKEHVEQFKDDYDAFYLLALNYYVNGKTSETVNIIASILKNDGEFERVHKNFAFLSILKENLEKSGGILQKLIKKEKDDLSARVALTQIYLRTDENDKYKQEYQILAKSIRDGEKNSPCFHVNKATFHSKAGNFNKAKDELEIAKSEYKYCICADVEMIRLLISEKDYDLAYKRATSAFFIDYSFLPLLAEVFKLYYYLRKDRELEKLYASLLALSPGIILKFFNNEKIILRIKLSDLKDSLSLKINGILKKYQSVNADFTLESGNDMLVYNLFRDMEICDIKRSSGGES